MGEGSGGVQVMIDEIGRAIKQLERQADMLGNAALERAISATLRVSPNGTGVDGLSLRTAFTTIQDALDAASTDDEDCTLILISPHGAGYYDINTTGDPTWAANVILLGTHRNWAKIMNDHDGATSILKLTGRSSVIDLNFNLGTGNNGLIQTRGGARTRHCQFVGQNLTGAAIALWYDTASQKHFKAEDIDFLGHVTYMTAFKVDDLCCSEFERLRIHKCLIGVHIVGDNADGNIFDTLDIGECAKAIKIDAGNEQHFNNITFHGNTLNVEDIPRDHIWVKIHGAFPITTSPDDLAGVTITAGVGANTWSAADVQVRAAAGKPFRIVGVTLDPAANEKYRIRLFDGSTYFSDIWAEGGVGAAAKGTQASSGTEFIFNIGTVISASAKSETGGNNIQVSLQIQEI